MAVVAQHQQGVFTVPVNATPGNADEVRGNDNTLRATYNVHDADPQLHVQMSTLAARPAAGTVERLWITTDGLRAYVDAGASWSELAYLPLAGGAITGSLTVAGTLGATGAVTLGNSIALGTGAATAGWVRLINTGNIVSRNAANSDNYPLLSLSAGDVLQLGSSVGISGIVVDTAVGAINLRVGGVTWFYVTSTEVAALTTFSVTGAAVFTSTVSVSNLLSTFSSIRLANNTTLLGRNAADSGDIALVGITTANNVQVGGTTANNLQFVTGVYGTAWQVEQISGTLHPIQDVSVDFGSPTLRIANGHFGFSVRVGSNPAASGAVRIPNNVGIGARNAGNTADIPLIVADNTDAILIGGTTTVIAGGLTLSVPAAAAIRLQVNGVNRLSVDAANVSVGGTLFATTFSGSGASLTALPAGQLTGTVPSAALTGTYSAVTGLTTGALTVTGTATLARADVTRIIWTRVTQGTGTSYTVDAATGTLFEWTGTTGAGTRTWNNPTNGVTGQEIILVYRNADVSNNQTVAFGTNFRYDTGDAAVTVPAGASLTARFYLDGTVWRQIGEFGAVAG